ncbi:phosphoglucosamine mutase [Candidatus Micrarchaeota archaeon]|nr:phosphoglucosamine mutase [Candidatus Micrarchaeota archaeon]
MVNILFGTSGIRGVVNEGITPELALILGRVIVKKRGARIAIGRDTRLSGPILEEALVAGINSSGGCAIKLGVVSTPTVAIATRERAERGVMITASHNPPQYNGFKLYNRFGEEMSRDEEKAVESALATNKFGPFEPDGTCGSYNVEDAVERHMEIALGLTDLKAIGRRKPTVVVDCGNGAACSIAPFLLKKAGCRVISVNAEPSGVFSRVLEPNRESLEDACSLVRSSGADMGVGYDGDGDRAVVIDESGEVLGLDEQLSLLSSHIARNGGTVVSTVEASLAVREAVEKNGGKLITTEVGSRNVAEAIRANGAVFGGEPCGEYIFPEEVLSPDGMLATLKFVELLCKEGRLGKLRKNVKKYPIKRAKFSCSDRKAAMERIKGIVTREFRGEVNESDGVRVDFSGGWLLVRASGTEPIIRITCEHRNKNELEKVFSKAERIVKEGVQ